MRGNEFARGSDVERYGERRCRRKNLQQLLHELRIAVGRFDEELRLSLGTGPLLQPPDRLRPLGRLDGQVAVEGERLAVEDRKSVV